MAKFASSLAVIANVLVVIGWLCLVACCVVFLFTLQFMLLLLFELLCLLLAMFDKMEFGLFVRVPMEFGLSAAASLSASGGRKSSLVSQSVQCQSVLVRIMTCWLGALDVV